MAGLARGKIIVGDASGDPSALSVGSANTVLQSDGTDATWNTVATDMIADNAVTLAKMAGLARGKIIVGDASGDPSALAVGSANTVLQSDGTDATWNTVATDMIADNAVTLAKMAGLARGKIIVGDASGDPSALAAGANGKILVANADGDPSWTTLSGDASLSSGDITLAASQTSITSILNTSLVVGRDTDNQIKFSTDNNIIFRFNAADRVTMNASGALTCTGDITALSSDKRLKTNIEIIEDPLEKVKALSGFTYDWSIDQCNKVGFMPPKERQIGVFAQDVQSVIPEAVKPAPFDHVDGKSKSGDNYLTVQYDKIVPLLIECIKTQETKIQDLQGQIDELKDKIL